MYIDEVEELKNRVEQLEKLFVELAGCQYRLLDPKKPDMVFLDRTKWYEVLGQIDINSLHRKYKY